MLFLANYVRLESFMVGQAGVEPTWWLSGFTDRPLTDRATTPLFNNDIYNYVSRLAILLPIQRLDPHLEKGIHRNNIH